MANRYWINGSGNINDTAHWSTSSGGIGGASVPTSVDNIIFDVNSSTIAYIVTLNVSINCADWITSDPLTGTLTFYAPIYYISVYGDINLHAGILFSGNPSDSIFYLMPPAGTTHYLNTNGASLPFGWYVNNDGTIILSNDLYLTNNSQLWFKKGTFNANNKNVTATKFVAFGTGTRTLILGSGVWTATGIGGWDVVLTTITLPSPSSTSTIKLTANSSNDTTFNGGGYTYGVLEITTTGNGKVAFGNYNNTFDTIKLTSGAIRRIAFTGGTIQTATNWILSGSVGNLNVITSLTGVQHTLVKTGGGMVGANYLDLSWSIGLPSSPQTWYAGTNSTNNGNNTNWSFTDSALPKAINGTLTFNGNITTNHKTITGITKDALGNALGNCLVRLIGSNTRMQTAKTTSDVNGNFSLRTASNEIGRVLVVKNGTPNIQGISDQVTPQ